MLRDRVEDFIASGSCPDEFYGLLSQCVADGTLEGLACARRLYESDYGGFTDLYDYQLRAPAAATLVIWGEAGIQALLDGARANPGSKNFSLCVQLLSSIAAASALPPLSFVRDHALAEKIETARRAAPHLSEFCRTRLVEFVLSIELDDDVAEHIGGSIARPNLDMPAAKEVFAALSTRWLAVSTPVLKRYEALIIEQPDNEQAFQRFLTEHSQLLDPMAVQVWPQPNLFGSRFPDFVVRRADDSYVIVEIERPSKALVTAGGHLSAEVTHAEQQATDYRSYLIQHLASARVHFPSFDDPECLVVTGLERSLDQRKKAVLRDANCHRHRLRIVGFDWLADRAHAVAANIMRRHVQVVDLRVT
jgi:Domain of unknown function (DUF4263)